MVFRLLETPLYSSLHLLTCVFSLVSFGFWDYTKEYFSFLDKIGGWKNPLQSCQAPNTLFVNMISVFILYKNSLDSLLNVPYWHSTYITISTFTPVRPSSVGGVGVGVPLSWYQFLQSYYKVSLIKVAWYVLRVKNMHSWAPPDPWGPWDEEKPSYIH